MRAGNRSMFWVKLVFSVSMSALASGQIYAQDLSVSGSEPDAATPADSSAGPSESSDMGAAAPAYDQTIAVNTDDAEPALAEYRQSHNRFVDEIIVTAQKRAENLQDVPISVSAFSSDMLDAKGIDNPADLQKATPGLTYTTAVGFSLIYLRGVGSDAFLMADPSVALYIDGIYFPFAQGLAQSFGALERVEVLKGPQGTLFGRNAVGGAINIITKSPSDTPELSVLVSYGDYAQKKARVHANVPLTDDVAISASAFYNTGESYYKNSTADGQPLPQETGKGARLKLKWKPTEESDLTLAGFKLNQVGAGSLFTPNIKPTPLFAAVIQPQTGYEAHLSFPTYSSLDNTVYYAEANSRFDWLDTKLLASDQYIQTRYSYDYDGSNVPIAGFDSAKQYADVQTAELQLLSNATSWGSEWLKWIGGAYFFKSVQGFDPVKFSLVDFDIANGSLAGIQLPGGFNSTLQGLLAQIPGIPSLIPDLKLPLRALLGTRSVAGFAQSTLTITDWLSLTAGMRYQVEARRVIASSSQVETVSGATLPIPLCDGVNGGDIAGCHNANEPLKRTTKSFKPKVSLEFRPFDKSLIYVSYQQALKSGTFNAVTLYDAPDYVKPEQLNAYEVGSKSSLFGGLATFNVAAFQYDIKNAQVQFVSVAQGGAVSFENAGKSRVRGIDFDTLMQLFPNSIDDLIFTASGAFLDGVYTDYRDARGYSETTGLAFQNGDYTGNRTVRTPKFSGVLGLSKTFHFDTGSLELATDAYYNSGFYFSPQNTAISFQKSYAVLNGHISYLYESWKLRVTVFGDNLTGRRYQTGQFTTDFGTNSYQGSPITYGMRLNWDY